MLAPDDPLAIAVTDAIASGAIDRLRRLLDEHPGLPTERIGDAGESRTLLHVATDWPGRRPEVGRTIAELVAAGAVVDARFAGPHEETALHWAASSDDVEAVDALLDAGADIEADGAVIGGGTPLSDAVAFGQWSAARRLVERGARVELWHAAALGLIRRLAAELADRPTADDLANALWHAAAAGRGEACDLLLEAGADAARVGHDDLTPARAAERAGHGELAARLAAAAAPSTA